MIDANHPDLKSFVPVSSQNPFPIQNLPFGVFAKKDGQKHCGTAIGNYVLDLTVLEEEGFFNFTHRVFSEASLNKFMSQGKRSWISTRQKISEILRDDNPILKDNRPLLERVLLLQSDVRMLMPVKIGDYTDFYSSKEHATNIGLMIRDPKNPLMPNWKHLPVAYHGRASSIVISDTPIIRPWGQVLDGEKPIFTPTRRLDFELELAFLVGQDSEQGQPVSVDDAEDYIFGFVLMNDWSARDIQRWEYQPLGPFVSKSFATSLSSWIVTAEALKPFRVKRPDLEEDIFPYLQDKDPLSHYDINLEVGMKAGKQEKETVISRSNSRHIYWSAKQQLAHHTITGCNLKVGDLMASGTISGKEKGTYGSLMELTWNATESLSIGGESRTFLQDGDQVSFRGYCQADGYRIGFGDLTGLIHPAIRINFN